MRLSELDYALPTDRIAQRPAEPRDSSRLLVLERVTGEIEHAVFRDVGRFLDPGDLLVVNDTRVTARRLVGRKAAGGTVEVLLLRELEAGRYEALAKPAKRLGPGTVVEFGDGLRAAVCGETAYGGRVLQFEDALGLRNALVCAGTVPLPPYIRTPLENEERYQTVYSSEPGSAAAPTAGLHFTDELLGTLRRKGITIATLTLDVSIDTFRPVSAEDLADHKMHGERFTIPSATAGAIERCEGRVVAVGTTTVRALESAAEGQRRVCAGSGLTDIFITPGYGFNVVDAMITNFHLPRTTMLAMVAAMCGVDPMRNAYSAALAEGYRFLSFGDGMLILSRKTNEKR